MLKFLTLSNFLMCYVYLNSAFEVRNINMKSEQLLMKSDLNLIYKTIKSVVDYTWRNPQEVDINIVIGLFISKVNLKWALIHHQNRIPEAMETDILNTLYKTNKLLQSFKFRNNVSPNGETINKVETLFIDDETWIKSLKSFHFTNKETTEFFAEANINSYENPLSFDNYTDIVYDFDHIMPGPVESDKCLVQLAKKKNSTSQHLKTCNIGSTCEQMLIKGSSYGYAISHRLLWILAARLGKTCAIISRTKDKILAQEFCKLMYEEAKYIASNEFVISDLMFEQMALCGLDGFHKFFRRSWMLKLMELQTNYGCFRFNTNYLQKGNKHTAMFIVKYAVPIAGGKCDMHVTAVALGAYSSAFRFIMDTYY